MIEVNEENDGTFTISWDENDLKESILNTFKEEDFIRVISEHLEKLENDGRTESTT